MAEAALQLNDAENKFFESGGETVDKSLTEGLPVEPKPAEPAVAAEPAEPTETTEPKAKTPAEIAAESEAATKARQKLLADLGAVPLEALQEARQESKTLKQQQADLLAWRQQVEPLLKQLKPAEQGNPYDPNTQPNEYSAYEWNALQNKVKELTEGQQRTAQERAAQEQSQRIMNWGQAQERAFIEKQPDYADAAKFAREARSRQLAVFNPDPAWIDATINNEIAGIIAQAAQATMQGIPTNPAEKAYQYAIANGYAPKGKTQDNDAVAAAAKIQAGQQASGGLKGGAAPKGKISPEELAAIDTTTKAGKKRFDDGWKELYG